MVVAGFIALGAAQAQAADKVLIGKAVTALWAFVPADIGIELGIFAHYGIDAEVLNMGNSPRLHQALTAGSLDFGMSSGADLAFVAKGEPSLAVAGFATQPRNISIVTITESPLKTVADLKGKMIAMSGVGSVSEWLVRQMAIQEGWGQAGVTTVAMGSFEANLAAIKTHQVDAMVGSVEVGYQLEERHQGRIIAELGQYAPHFHTHMLFARQQLIAEKPDLVARFLKGFFASIAYMKANKEKTSEIAAKSLNESVAIMNRVYDEQIGMLEDDGHIDPQAVEVMKDSFIEMGMLTTRPTNDQILTTQFLPVRP